MMSHPIGIKILKKYGPMTGRAVKSQSASRRKLKSPVHGGQKIHAGQWLTPVSLERLGTVVWCDSPVVDVQKKNRLHITKIMTNLLRLSGSVNPVTSNVTKN